MKVRRVIVANDNGRSKVHQDGMPPRTAVATETPGYAQSFVWSTQPQPGEAYDGIDPTVEASTLLPPPGGTSAIVLSVAPNSTYADPNFDPVAANAETAELCPGLIDCFEPDNPGVHTTPTVDYNVILDGEVWLELDDGETLLTAGDIVVQHGTRHAWRNKTEKPASILAILIGSNQAE